MPTFTPTVSSGNIPVDVTAFPTGTSNENAEGIKLFNYLTQVQNDMGSLQSILAALDATNLADLAVTSLKQQIRMLTEQPTTAASLSYSPTTYNTTMSKSVNLPNADQLVILYARAVCSNATGANARVDFKFFRDSTEVITNFASEPDKHDMFSTGGTVATTRHIFGFDTVSKSAATYTYSLQHRAPASGFTIATNQSQLVAIPFGGLVTT